MSLKFVTKKLEGQSLEEELNGAEGKVSIFNILIYFVIRFSTLLSSLESNSSLINSQ